eukprot:3402696-Rhodomonas_salina.1
MTASTRPNTAALPPKKTGAQVQHTQPHCNPEPNANIPSCRSRGCRVRGSRPRRCGLSWSGAPRATAAHPSPPSVPHVAHRGLDITHTRCTRTCGRSTTLCTRARSLQIADATCRCLKDRVLHASEPDCPSFPESANALGGKERARPATRSRGQGGQCGRSARATAPVSARERENRSARARQRQTERAFATRKDGREKE